MDGLGQEPAYDELFEPLALALGHLVLGMAFLEKAMLTDLIQRQVVRGGAEAVFGRGLVTELERRPAGKLLSNLRELGYEEELAERIADVIRERNHFIHHLYADPEFMRAWAQRKGIEEIVLRVEALATRLHELTRELEPAVTAGLNEMFGCSPVDLLDQIKQIDPNELDDAGIRGQLEALQEFPDDMLSEGV